MRLNALATANYSKNCNRINNNSAPALNKSYSNTLKNDTFEKNTVNFTGGGGILDKTISVGAICIGILGGYTAHDGYMTYRDAKNFAYQRENGLLPAAYYASGLSANADAYDYDYGDGGDGVPDFFWYDAPIPWRWLGFNEIANGTTHLPDDPNASTGDETSSNELTNPILTSAENNVKEYEPTEIGSIDEDDIIDVDYEEIDDEQVSDIDSEDEIFDLDIDENAVIQS